MAQKVATIVGRPGMCRDDGSAITYYYQVQTNEYGGTGWYSEPRGFFNDEYGAMAWAMHHRYDVTNVVRL